MLAKRVFGNVVYNSTSILISSLAGVLVTVYLARVLKPELFGIYSLTISTAFLLMTFTDLGVNTTLIRYVADSYGKKEYELMRGYIRSLGKLKLVLTFTVSLTLFLSSDVLSLKVFHKPLLSIPLKVVSAYVFLFSLLGFVNGIFNAFNDFKANLIRSLTYEFSRLLFILIFVSMGLAVVGAVLGFVVASLVSLIVLIVLLLSKYSFILGKAERIDWRRVLRFASYLTLGSVTWVVFAYVDSVMIGIFLPAEDVGFYRAAYNIVGAISGFVSIPAVLFPVFVQLEGRDLRNAFNRAFKYSSTLAFPIVFGLIIVGKPLIEFVYGTDYLPAVNALDVLSFLILSSALGFWSVIFNAKEKPEYPVYVTFVAMLMNVVLNYIMILRWGIVGAGIATVMSNIFSWISLAYLSRKMFGISFSINDVFKPLISSIIMFTVLLKFKLSMLLGVAVGALVYLAVLTVLKGLTREDIAYLRTVFGW